MNLSHTMFTFKKQDNIMHFLWLSLCISTFISLQGSAQDITFREPKTPYQEKSRLFLRTIFPKLEKPNLSMIDKSLGEFWHDTTERGYPLFLCNIVDKSRSLNSLTKSGIPELTSITIMDIGRSIASLKMFYDLFEKNPTLDRSALSASLFFIPPVRSDKTKPEAILLQQCDLNNLDKYQPLAGVFNESWYAPEIEPKQATLKRIEIYKNLGEEYFSGKHKDHELALPFFKWCIEETRMEAKMKAQEKVKEIVKEIVKKIEKEKVKEIENMKENMKGKEIEKEIEKIAEKKEKEKVKEIAKIEAQRARMEAKEAKIILHNNGNYKKSFQYISKIALEQGNFEGACIGYEEGIKATHDMTCFFELKKLWNSDHAKKNYTPDDRQRALDRINKLAKTC